MWWKIDSLNDSSALNLSCVYAALSSLAGAATIKVAADHSQTHHQEAAFFSLSSRLYSSFFPVLTSLLPSFLHLLIPLSPHLLPPFGFVLSPGTEDQLELGPADG